MSELINQMKLNNHIMMLVNEVIWKYPDMIGIDEVFDYANKIEIIHQDALEYLVSISENEFDVVFADLWHNAEDGIKLYEKIKIYESKHTCTKFIYWLENSLKSKKKWNERIG